MFFITFKGFQKPLRKVFIFCVASVKICAAALNIFFVFKQMCGCFSNNKRMSKVLEINFALSDDEIQSLHSLADSNFGC